MLLIRAITQRDFDGLMALAAQVGPGMTTLKPDPVAIGRRIDIACASFAGALPVPERDYVFVMEDMETQRVVGVCAIKGAVGLEEPFYNYRIGTLVHSSRELKVFSRMDTLYLSNDLTGCAELCSLFLEPAYRTGNNGRMLSKSRFLFIAQFPELFTERLIAEMRGYQRPDGTSPLWEHLGRHFFKMDFHRADDLTSLGQKSFIAELMPRHPLYVAFLPQEAQDVIGRTHVDTAPARRLLEQEGMHYEGYVDIFDGGPVMQARTIELRAMRDSALAAIVDADDHERLPDAEPMLVSSTSMQNFRVVVASGAAGEDIALSAQQREALGCNRTDTVRTMTLNPRKAGHG